MKSWEDIQDFLSIQKKILQGKNQNHQNKSLIQT